MSQLILKAKRNLIEAEITGAAHEAEEMARALRLALEAFSEDRGEVRGRGTGKTHRMLENVRDCEAENIVVVAHSHHFAQCLKHMFWTKILKHHEVRVSLNQRDRVIRPLTKLRKQVIHFAVHGEPWMTEWLGRHRDLPVIFTDHAVWELA